MSLMQIVCVSLCFLAIGHADADIDPCYNHKTLQNLGSRNEICDPGEIHLYDLLCDSYLTTDWYITEKAVMLNHEPNTGSCGVDIPLWLKDPFPKMSDGIMDRTVCVKTDGDACKETVTIQIKNCSSFYVYNLRRLPDHLGCPAAYCFVSNELCHAQQSLTSTMTTSSQMSISDGQDNTDPCLNHKTLQNLGSRNEICDPGDIHLYDLLCDSYLTTDWYITEKAVMLNHEPNTGSCGVDIPLWLKDPFPKMSDGIMDRTVCVKTDSDACKETVTIQIKNCSSFYVYNLQRLPDHLGCPAAYCFVSTDLCHAQQSLTSTMATSRPMSISDGTNNTDERTTNSDIKQEGPSYQITTPLIVCLTVSVCVIAVLVAVIVVLVLRRKRNSGIGAAEMRKVEPARCGKESPPPVYECISTGYVKY